MTAYFGSKKIKKVYLGTQNTNCLTHIPNDINLSLDPLNVTVTGSPTISSGVVSGFSASNYVTLPEAFSPSSSTWEIVEKIKFSALSGTQCLFGSRDYNMPLVSLASGKLRLYVSSNGSSWNITNEKVGSYTFLTDTDYWIKLEFTGSNYILSYSTDGTNYTEQINKSSSSIIKGGSKPVFGNAWTNNPDIYGTVDLTKSYIKINGKEWWKGGTGKLTLKKDSKVYVPNGKNADGSLKFNEKIASVDCGFQDYYLSDGQYMLFDNSSLSSTTLRRALTTKCVSSTTTPSDTSVCWYNLTDNLIQVYQNNIWTGSRTLPLGIFTVSGGSITSIDQVFNGFGFIGSTIYALPGVKGLIPDGFNTNGTYKSIEVDRQNVVVTNVTGNATRYILLGTTGLGYWVTPNVEYNSKENLLYVDGEVWKRLIAGTVVSTDGKITSLTPNKVQPEMIGREITRIYKGSTLVYGYKPNTVLLEKSTAGTYTLNLEHSGDYEVTIVGGGGGAAYNVSTKFSDGVISGGSGAGFKGIIHLKAGTHTVKVGAGGTSVNPGNASTAMPKVGSSSSIGSIITAGCANADGTANAGFNGSGNVISKGGVLTYDKTAVRSYTIATNGNDGLQGWNTSVEGAASVISGTTYGAGDIGKNGAMSKGQDGYIKIVAV